MVTALIVVSCAKEEEPIQEAAKVTAKKVVEPPQQTEEVAVKEREVPPQTTERPPVSDIALRPPQKQTKDIMSGNPVKSNIYSDYAGKRVYFCCDESKRRFDLEPDNWIKRAGEMGIMLQDAPASR
jgi:YHS domain-containing protein